MSRKDGSISMPLATAAFVCAIVLGGALVTAAFALIAVGDPFASLATGGPLLAAAAGFAIVTIALCRVTRRLVAAAGKRDGDDGEDGGGPGWEQGPHPPSDEPDWWPEFERDLRAYLEARERVPVAG